MAIFSKTTERKEEKAEAQSSEKTEPIGLPLVLIQPRISEKASQLIKLNKYVFLVKKAVNAILVKKAVELKYKVKVLKVNMQNIKGKVKTSGRVKGETAGIRKAIVTLKKGDSIQGMDIGA